jgi:cell division protein FtsI/penicillin-binding protein 2
VEGIIEMKFAIPTRFQIIGVCLSLFGLMVVLQMVNIQGNANVMQIRDESNQIYEFNSEKITPERGAIYDRWGSLLAGNKEVYEVGVELKTVNSLGNEETIANVLSSVLGLEYQEVLDRVNLTYDPANNQVYVVVADFISPAKIEQLRSIQDDYAKLYANQSKKSDSPQVLTGLSWTPHLQRTYPENYLASNVLGFYSLLDIEKGEAHLGVEEKYNSLLRGTPIEIASPVDPNKIKEYVDVPPGSSLILTIDREIQASVEEILDQAVIDNGAQSGTIIVMDPKTGEIIAMASNPRLNPNVYWEYGSNYYNRSIDITYEPGSVFKVLTMAIALDTKAVKPETEFTDTGSINIGGINIYNWDRAAWGVQDMTGCLQHSLNVCLAWVATEIGPDDFYSYLQNFGMGRKTNIDLAGEVTWPLSVPGDTWVDADLGANSFGQGLAVTPIQMITAISAVANDGKMMSPHILKSVIDNGQRRDSSPMIISKPISEETAHTLTNMLATSLEREASSALVPGYRLAGKTGTAEIAGPNGYTNEFTNASFVGWGPVDDPQFIVYIWIEKPSSSIWGSVVAAPVFSDVVSRLVVLMDIPPDDIRQQIENKLAKE